VFDKTQYGILMRCEEERNERIRLLKELKFPREFPILPKSAVISFGSTAHGLCFPESDIDICVLYDDRNVAHSVYMRERSEFMKKRKALEGIVKSKKNVDCTFKCARFGAVALPKTGKGVSRAVSNGVKFLYSFCITGQNKFDACRTLFFNACENVSHLERLFLEHRGIHNCFEELKRDMNKDIIKPKVLRNCTLFLSQALKIEHLKEKGRVSFLETVEDLTTYKKLSEDDASTLCLAMERSLYLQRKAGAKEKPAKIKEEDRKIVQQVLRFYMCA
jgi:predicted nucleotidyltransferase